MDKNVDVNLDLMQEEEPNFEGLMISRNPNIAVGVFSSLATPNESGNYVVRLYTFKKLEDESYYPINELEAFSFLEKKQLQDFIQHLPNLSAIELLLLINPLPIESDSFAN